MKYKRDQIESFFIDVCGYSEQEMKELSIEELKIWVSDLNEEYKEDFKGYMA